MQKSLNSLQKWSKTKGYKFSNTNSTCIVFSKRELITRNHNLILNNQPLSTTYNVKILRLKFDKLLTWISHIT